MKRSKKRRKSILEITCQLKELSFGLRKRIPGLNDEDGDSTVIEPSDLDNEFNNEKTTTKAKNVSENKYIC